MIKKDITGEGQTSIRAGVVTEGERLEEFIERAMSNKEPIEAISPIIYQARDQGVDPMYNIRTDRWDIALGYSGEMTKTNIAKRTTGKVEETTTEDLKGSGNEDVG